MTRPMHRWLRWLLVWFLRFALRRGVAADQLRAVLSRAYPRRPEDELDDIMLDAIGLR